MGVFVTSTRPTETGPAPNINRYCKQFADQVLFMTASLVSETVEGCCLICRQPDE